MSVTLFCMKQWSNNIWSLSVVHPQHEVSCCVSSVLVNTHFLLKQEILHLCSTIMSVSRFHGSGLIDLNMIYTYILCVVERKEEYLIWFVSSSCSEPVSGGWTSTQEFNWRTATNRWPVFTGAVLYLEYKMGFRDIIYL